MITRPIVIIDGVVQDSSDAHVSIADAAFSPGEGILETMLAVDGRIVREAPRSRRARTAALGNRRFRLGHGCAQGGGCHWSRSIRLRPSLRE